MIECQPSKKQRPAGAYPPTLHSAVSLMMATFNIRGSSHTGYHIHAKRPDTLKYCQLSHLAYSNLRLIHDGDNQGPELTVAGWMMLRFAP